MSHHLTDRQHGSSADYGFKAELVESINTYLESDIPYLPVSLCYLPTQAMEWQNSLMAVIKGSPGKSDNILTIGNMPANAIARFEAGPSIFHYRQLLGFEFTHEPGDFYYRDYQSLTELVNELTNIKEAFAINRIKEASPSVNVLHEKFRDKGFIITHRLSGCPYIKINPGAHEINDVLSSRLLSDLKRAERKAQGHGRLSFRIVKPRTKHAFLFLYEQFVALENKGWKGRAGTSLQNNRQQSEFFQHYGENMADRGGMLFATMYIDDRPVAMHYATEANHSYWLFKIAFDESFSDCSPGQLLIRYTLDYAIQHKFRSYEFLGSEEGWIKRWTQEAWPTVRIEIYPFSMHGLIALLGSVSRYLGQKIHRLTKKCLRH